MDREDLRPDSKKHAKRVDFGGVPLHVVEEFGELHIYLNSHMGWAWAEGRTARNVSGISILM